MQKVSKNGMYRFWWACFCWHPLMFQHSLLWLFGYSSSFCFCRRPYTRLLKSLLLQMFLTFLLSLLLLALLLLMAYLLLLAYPAVAGLTTIVNTLFVIGFSTNSGVPAIGWRPPMFQLSLVLLPVLQLLFFLVLLLHPWVSCGESLCCGCRLYCCWGIFCYCWFYCCWHPGYTSISAVVGLPDVVCSLSCCWNAFCWWHTRSPTILLSQFLWFYFAVVGVIPDIAGVLKNQTV